MGSIFLLENYSYICIDSVCWNRNKTLNFITWVRAPPESQKYNNYDNN